MPTAAFTTLGCKVNQYETQRILESFEEAGFSIAPFDGPADVYVINSCSVTSIAEGKSRYAIRRAKRFNPSAKVVVTGCAGQMSLIKGEAIEGADLIVPNPEKLRTLNKFVEAFGSLDSPSIIAASESPEVAKPAIRTRATLKVQDGCNVFCSYCSIPYTRPGMSSRPAVEVLEEAQRMIDMGYRELILTGVLIGAYGPESGSQGPDFEELVGQLAQLRGSYRLRISSIEMRQVTDRLIELIKSGAVVPHLHIPLQCGDSDVLRDMNRPYSAKDYLNLCDRLYAEVPDLSITTDVMVGFPSEDDERFMNSLATVRAARFLKAHVFRFSPRFGTPADAWGDPIENAEKIRRSTALMAAATETGSEHCRRFLGRTMRVLVEGKETRDGLLCGLTDNYLEVAFAGPASMKREFAWIRLEQMHGGAVFGEVAPEPSVEARRRDLSVLSL